MVAEELKLIVKAEVDEAVRNLKGFQDQANKSQEGLSNVSKEVGLLEGVFRGFVASVGVREFMQFFNKSIEAYGNAAAAQARLGATLRAAGGAFGFSESELNKMAKTLSRVTGIEDDTITNAQAMLLAFDQIGKDVFPQALASAADLSVFLGQDLSTSARLLGRALQNPADGVTALGRANVKFSEDQELAIKKMAESGDIAGAQDAILSKVQERLGDVAEMVGNTGTSAWVKFRQAMGNSMELQGKYNTDVLSPFLNLMTGSVNAVNDAREAVDGMVDSLLKGKNIFQTWKEFEKATGASPLAPMKAPSLSPPGDARSNQPLSSIGNQSFLGGRKPLEAIGEIAGGAADYARYLEAADVASKSLFDTWDTGANQILDNSGTRLGEMLADVTKQVESLNESIERAFGDAARETFVAFGEAMVDASSGAEAMKDVVKSLLGTVLRALAEEAFAYAAFYLALGNLPKSIALGAAGAAALVASGVVQAMGEGGIVTGPTRALIGEKGPEAVIPLDRMRGLGTTIIVQGNVVRERDMYRAADKWRRRAYAGY